VDYRTPNIYDPSTLTEPYAYARANPTMFWDPDGLSTRTERNIRVITFKLDGTRAEFEVDDQIWQQVLFGQRKWGDFGFEGAPKDGYEIHQRSQKFEEYLIVQHLKHEHLFENSKYERISGLETIGRDVAIGLYASVFAPYIGVATILGAFSPTSIIFAKYMGGSIAASYLLTQAVVIPADAIQGTDDAEKVADAYSEIVLPVFASQYLGIAFQEGLAPGVTFYPPASNNSSRLAPPRGPVVIGETMRRVEAAASRIPGSKILNDMPDFKAIAQNADQVTSLMMQYNRKWILEQMRSGRPILDIGIDPNRAVPSIFYQMEQNMIKNYQKLHPEWNSIIKP